MLRGSYPAKVDEKSRLRLPAKFRRDLPETEDNEYYITSYNGKFAQIYPVPIWDRIASKLQETPRMDKSKVKYQLATDLYGAMSEMDPQGRILLPQRLRESARLSGDVVVCGRKDHLEVWNQQTISEEVETNPLTAEDIEHMAEMGF